MSDFTQSDYYIIIFLLFSHWSCQKGFNSLAQFINALLVWSQIWSIPRSPSTSDNNIFQGDLFSGSKTFFTHDILSTWMCECRWGMFSPLSSWLPIPMTVFLLILSVLPCQRNQKIMSWISYKICTESSGRHCNCNFSKQGDVSPGTNH